MHKPIVMILCLCLGFVLWSYAQEDAGHDLGIPRSNYRSKSAVSPKVAVLGEDVKVRIHLRLPLGERPMLVPKESPTQGEAVNWFFGERLIPSGEFSHSSIPSYDESNRIATGNRGVFLLLPPGKTIRYDFSLSALNLLPKKPGKYQVLCIADPQEIEFVNPAEVPREKSRAVQAKDVKVKANLAILTVGKEKFLFCDDVIRICQMEDDDEYSAIWDDAKKRLNVTVKRKGKWTEAFLIDVPGKKVVDFKRDPPLTRIGRGLWRGWSEKDRQDALGDFRLCAAVMGYDRLALLQSYRRAGKHKEAEEILDHMVQRISGSGNSGQEFVAIVSEYWANGQRGKARRLLGRISAPWAKTRVLVDIARRCIASGDKKLASQSLSKATETAKTMKDDEATVGPLGQSELQNARAVCLFRVAAAYAALGDRNRADKIFSDAVESAKLKKGNFWRTHIFTEMAIEYGSAGDEQRSLKYLREAEKSVGGIEHYSHRHNEQARTSKAYVAMGKLEDARKVAKPLHFLWRSELYLAIGKEYLADGKKDSARQVMVELRATQKGECDLEIMAGIAALERELGMKEESAQTLEWALKAADGMISERESLGRGLRGLAYLAAEYAVEGRFTEALKIVENIDRRGHASFCALPLILIADRLEGKEVQLNEEQKKILKKLIDTAP